MLCQNDSRMTRGGRGLCHDPDSGEGRTEAGVESGSPLELLSISATGLLVCGDWSLNHLLGTFIYNSIKKATNVLIFLLQYLSASVRDVSGTPEADWNDCGAAV